MPSAAQPKQALHGPALILVFVFIVVLLFQG
jgi:hypothetical protein